MRIRLSPRHARLSNHAGHQYLKGVVDGQLNILHRLENQIVNDENKRMLVEQRQNSFGLGMNYIQCRKASVQPKNSESMTARGLSPILQNSEGSE